MLRGFARKKLFKRVQTSEKWCNLFECMVAKKKWCLVERNVAGNGNQNGKYYEEIQAKEIR